jgi:hypothetical protein
MLEFHEEGHVYLLDGQRVPSCTEIVHAIFPQRAAGTWHMQRGSALHKATAFDEAGILDESTVDPAIAARLQHWRQFLRDWQPDGRQTWAIERPLASAMYGFAGTPDRVYFVRGQPWIIDIKSTHSPQAILQIGGYSLLFRQETGQTAFGGVVEVTDTGYNALWLGGEGIQSAERCFLACLTLYRASYRNYKGVSP